MWCCTEIANTLSTATVTHVHIEIQPSDDLTTLLLAATEGRKEGRKDYWAGGFSSTPAPFSRFASSPDSNSCLIMSLPPINSVRYGQISSHFMIHWCHSIPLLMKTWGIVGQFLLYKNEKDVRVQCGCMNSTQIPSSFLSSINIRRTQTKELTWIFWFLHGSEGLPRHSQLGSPGGLQYAVKRKWWVVEVEEWGRKEKGREREKTHRRRKEGIGGKSEKDKVEKSQVWKLTFLLQNSSY